jgi:hypothetical protein
MKPDEPARHAMRIPRFTVRRIMLAIAAVAGCLAVGAVLIQSPEDAGAAEARKDIAAGKLRLKTYGLPAHWFGNYSNLMKSRLGVETESVAGCVVNDGLIRNVAGYNARMEVEIDRRFGAGAHDKIVAEAQTIPIPPLPIPAPALP